MGKMTDKTSKAVVLLAVFIIVFAFHLLYFKTASPKCEESIGWVQKYILGQEYFIGISYGLSFAFMAFAFFKYKENNRGALKAAAGGGLLAVILSLSCFFLGCCGSPMLIIYLNFVGLSSLRIPKLALLLMTVAFIAIGYFCFIRKCPDKCCNGGSCRKEKNEEV